MPRGPRLDAPDALHHVLGRGIEGRAIFRADWDRDNFLRRLGAVAVAKTLAISACVMEDYGGSMVHFETSSGRPLTVLEPMVAAAKIEAQVAEW